MKHIDRQGDITPENMEALGRAFHLSAKPHAVRYEYGTVTGSSRVIWLQCDNALDAHVTAIALSMQYGAASVHQGKAVPCQYRSGRRVT